MLIADDVAAALGPEQVARLTGPEWDQQVQCWECDGWIGPDEDAAVLLLRVTDPVNADTGATVSFSLHSHPACSPSKILVMTADQVRARRPELDERTDQGDGTDVDVVATVFDTRRGTGYPVVLLSYQTELIADSLGPERMDLVVSGLVMQGWHPLTTLAEPPAAGPAGYRIRFSHEQGIAAAPGILEVINPSGQVDTVAEVTPGRYWRPGVVRTGQTVLIQGSRYLTDWQRRGRAGVKAAVRAGLLVGGVVPVELRGPGNDVPGSVYR